MLIILSGVEVTCSREFIKNCLVYSSLHESFKGILHLEKTLSGEGRRFLYPRIILIIRGSNDGRSVHTRIDPQPRAPLKFSTRESMIFFEEKRGIYGVDV
jgi:hypothetical protein